MPTIVLSRCGQLPCDPCGPSLEVVCASLTATPSLCGFSGYDDGTYDGAHPELWAGQGKKWTVRTLGGGSVQSGYTGTGCTGSCDAGLSGRDEYSGETTWDGCSKSSTAKRDVYGGCPGAETHYGVVYGEDIQLFYGGQDPFTAHSTLTVKTSTPASGCFGTYYSQTRYDATSTLTVPDTVAAAIARETPEEGDSCCAVSGAAELTTPESEAALGLASSTSVTLTLTLRGEASTCYELTLSFENFIDSDDTPLADTTDTLAVETDGSGVWSAEYDIEQPDLDRRRCYKGWSYEIVAC